VLGWMQSYEDQKTAAFIQQNFLPVKAHIKGNAWQMGPRYA